MLATICKLAVVVALLVAQLAKATQPPSLGATLFDEIILQHGHLMLDRLHIVDSMSYEQVEVALSMLFFHKYLNPKQEDPLNETVFQKALLDNLYKLWQESGSSKPSSTLALSGLAFENCHLMRYLRMPLLKADHVYFKDGLQKHQRVHVSKAIEKINSELHNTENGNLFINSLIDLLPAMTVGYGLLVGDLYYWNHAKDAKVARVFMFAFLNLDFTVVEDYVSAENALAFLHHTLVLSKKIVIVWPKLFEINQYKNLGGIALSKEEGRRSDQKCKSKSIIRMKCLQQLYRRLTGNELVHEFQLTSVPFRSLSLICKQPLMLKKATMTEGSVYKNMSCLFQAYDPASRVPGFCENVLADLKEITKLESSIGGEDFTVSFLFIRHTKRFLFDRSFVLCQDFHALPPKVQQRLLTETKPRSVQPDEDTPTSIIASVQPRLGIIRNACKQGFTATELDLANKLDWFVLDVVCPSHRYRDVLLQNNQHPEQLPNKDGTKDILPENQCYQALWGANKSSPNNCQYVGIAYIERLDTSLSAELLIVPTIDTTDRSQRKAVLKVKGPGYSSMAIIWWDPKSKLVNLRKLSFDNSMCQVTIPQHLILDYCPQEYGLEHRMIVVLSSYELPTPEEAARMLTMKDRQLHDLKDQTCFGEWSIIAIKPKCLANLEYAPNFPLSRPNRFLAIASDFSGIQKLNPILRPGEVFTPSRFLVRIGKKLLHSVLMTSQNDPETSKASWLDALEDLGADQADLMNEMVEHGSSATIMSYLSEHPWTYSQLITGNDDVAGLPAVVRFLWHQHRLMIASMLGRIQDALNWDLSLASDLMALSMFDLLKSVDNDMSLGLISFFEQGFWSTASLERKQGWLQMMQYIRPHISSGSYGGKFMPKEELLPDSILVKENIIPAVSDGVLIHRQFVVRVKAIVGSEQAKMEKKVDFVPVSVSNNQFMIGSNQSGLHYAIIDHMNPSMFSIYAPDDMTRHEIKYTEVLVAHRCLHTLTKLLLNYALNKQRDILTFVLLEEHFLVYDMDQHN